MLAERVSHSTSSKEGTPGRLKYRFQASPFRLRFCPFWAGEAAVTLGRSADVFWVVRGINQDLRGWVKRPTSYDLGLGLSTSLQQNVWGHAARDPNIWSLSPLLILALLLLGGGAILLRLALRGARRVGLLSRSFWATFWEYGRYRVRRLWPAPVGLAGLILLMYGAVSLFQWVLAYYAARLGHPVSPGS
jgi:hypothetical protein